MAEAHQTETTIGDVNNALGTMIMQFINNDKIDIRFDLPDNESTPSTPTISIFLYEVHEDLRMRNSYVRRLDVSNKKLSSSAVHLKLNYLITYWEPNVSTEGQSPESKPYNQTAYIMTLVLQALLNNRQPENLVSCYTNVVPPQENLNSLGNFWQALGSRPRLSLGYSITVPISLGDALNQVLVESFETQICPIGEHLKT